MGLSGGVDSALSAALLTEQGHQVTGVFLECWNEPGCRTDRDRQDALAVALKLKIPFKVLDFKTEYRQKVLNRFYQEYRAGRTPNPDIWCNQEIKFGLFLDWAIKRGFDYVATGHYARLKNNRLLQSTDKSKDQTYFLAMLKERQLRRVLFPVGHLTKTQVRLEAKKRRLPVWNKKDSTGICLIGHDYSFAGFLKRKIKAHSGEVVNKQGESVGCHQGVEFYTIGQRHGFKLTEKSTRRPRYFVIDKNIKSNQLIVGSKQDLAKKEFAVKGWSWIAGRQSLQGLSLKVRIRHQGKLMPARIAGKKVILKQIAEGVAPGQVAVVYSGEECLGGGIIN